MHAAHASCAMYGVGVCRWARATWCMLCSSSDLPSCCMLHMEASYAPCTSHAACTQGGTSCSMHISCCICTHWFTLCALRTSDCMLHPRHMRLCTASPPRAACCTHEAVHCITPSRAARCDTPHAACSTQAPGSIEHLVHPNPAVPLPMPTAGLLAAAGKDGKPLSSPGYPDPTQHRGERGGVSSLG
jgi:hypothetical protein